MNENYVFLGIMCPIYGNATVAIDWFIMIKVNSMFHSTFFDSSRRYVYIENDEEEEVEVQLYEYNDDEIIWINEQLFMA